MSLGFVRLRQGPRSNRYTVRVELALIPSESAPDLDQHLVNGTNCRVHSRLREKGETELANGLCASLAELIVSALNYANRAMRGWLGMRKAISCIEYVLNVLPGRHFELGRYLPAGSKGL